MQELLEAPQSSPMSLDAVENQNALGPGGPSGPGRGPSPLVALPAGRSFVAELDDGGKRQAPGRSKPRRRRPELPEDAPWTARDHS
eukprot:7697575-Pyramimonas_sp.AAC.1